MKELYCTNQQELNEAIKQQKELDEAVYIYLGDNYFEVSEQATVRAWGQRLRDEKQIAVRPHRRTL